MIPSAPATTLGARMKALEADQRQGALRALLNRPLISAHGKDADVFTAIRRHADWLRSWLDHHTGWRLRVEPEFARLHKSPPDNRDTTRPAVDGPTGAPFTRRRYVLLCLAMVALEEAERQTVLGKIASRVVELAAADQALAETGMQLDLLQRDQRRDLVQAMRQLLDLGVLSRVDGDEEQFIRGSGDVLYNVDRGLLATMLCIRRGPSTIEATALDDRMNAMLSEPLVDTDEAKNRRLRWNLMGRLLDDPVLYYADLSEPELNYLTSQRPRIVRQIEEASGLVAEIRAEGIAIVDPSGALTDLDMPEEGTDGHAALLVAQWLAQRGRRDQHQGQPGPGLGCGRSPDRATPANRQVSDELSDRLQGPPGRVPLAELHALVQDLVQEHRHHWRRAVREPGAPAMMAEQIVDRLEALRLVRRTEGGLVPLPAIARYALDEPIEPERGPGQEANLWTAQ